MTDLGAHQLENDNFFIPGVIGGTIKPSTQSFIQVALDENIVDR
jgi:hypothetical protein